MKEELIAAAKGLQDVAACLLKAAEDGEETKPIDLQNLTEEDKEVLAQLTNVWMEHKTGEKFEEIEAKLGTLDEKLDDLPDFDDFAEKSDLPEDMELDGDDLQKLRDVARFFSQADPNDLVGREEMPDMDDYVLKADFDTDDAVTKSDLEDYVEKDELPDFSNDYDIEEIRDSANLGQEASERLDALIDELRPVMALTKLINAMGIKPELLAELIIKGADAGATVTAPPH
jgi:hypothetical protein